MMSLPSPPNLKRFTLFFFRSIKELAGGIFDMSVIAVSSTEVDMLAVAIRTEGMSLVARPRLRVMQGPPLSIHSAHPRHTLSSWPTACLRAQRKLCWTDAIFSESKCAFINIFRDFHAPQWLINKLLHVFNLE